MDRMRRAIGRVAQRDDQDIEPAPLESEDLLGNESLGQPRIALQNKGDAASDLWRDDTLTLRDARVPRSIRLDPGRAIFA